MCAHQFSAEEQSHSRIVNLKPAQKVMGISAIKILYQKNDAGGVILFFKE
jgi:hypothetical protein